MSSKRVLPALIMAGSLGFLGLHRFYAGRYITGLVQMACFVIGGTMLSHDLAGIYVAVQDIPSLPDWLLDHPVQPLPVILVSISSFWALVDCFFLAMRKFRDGKREVMTQWI